MPLDKLTVFTKKVQDLADKPNGTMTASEVKAQFDAAPNELRLAFNQLIDDLGSVVDGDSGADNVAVTAIAGLAGVSVQSVLEALKVLVDSKSSSTDVFTKTVLQSVVDNTSGADLIGATPIATSPATVQGILEWLKLQIDSTVLGQIPDGSVTPVKLSFDPATQVELDEHKADDTKHKTTAEQTFLSATDNAKFKKSNSIYTDNDNSQTFTDSFCTTNSLVTIVITSVTPPKGVWSVESAAGSFTITSTVAEDNDITFDYYIQKAVG